MADGIPCHWCGFMEASHDIYEGWTVDRPMPCEVYHPLEPAHMREIEQKRLAKSTRWSAVLPSLGTEYSSTRRALYAH